MSYSWFKIESISYGWFTMRIGSDICDVSDFLGYDMPKKFLDKVLRVISNNTEEWLYLMDEPGAGILHIYLENEKVYFEEYNLSVNSDELNNENEEAEWNKRCGNSWLHIGVSICDVVDGIVSEFALYENGNGRMLYEEHWGEFPLREFEAIKRYAFRLEESAGKYDGLFCATFLAEGDDTLAMVRKLSKESGTGLLFCYKALKRFHYDYPKALAYLRSDAFQNSLRTLRR